MTLDISRHIWDHGGHVGGCGEILGNKSAERLVEDLNITTDFMAELFR